MRFALTVACLGWLVHAGFAQATPGTGGGEIVPTHPLNDTGTTWSGAYPSGNATTCDPSHPAGQDCRYGRDAAAGQLTKIGGGSAGFDFTKISNSGAELPASAALGTGPGDWACTRDNVTKLIWEVKTTSGLRSQDHTYTWYNSDNITNGGSAGTTSGGSCHQTGRCDTEKYVEDVNSTGLCGATGWRMPTVGELTSIVDQSRTSPAIDTTYFPNTPSLYFWSGSPYAGDSSNAWDVTFGDGGTYYHNRYGGTRVRLVRAGQ